MFQKMRRCEEAEVSPPNFNLWLCLGIILSSLPLLAVEPRVFTVYGLASGALFTLSMACTLFAIQRLGLSSAAGIWCGTASVVSFVFAVKVKGEQIHLPGLAVPGLLLLVAGLVGIATNGQVANHQNHRKAMADQENQDEGDAAPPGARMRKPSYISGTFSAFAAGIFGGLLLAPQTWAPASVQGVNYVPSIAAGVVISAPIVNGALLLAGREPLALKPRAAALPGICAGVTWNAGNVLSILAVNNPRVGYAIAFPIYQCGLVVAGLWGIILFHELKGKQLIGYWASTVLLIVGATMMAVSKAKPQVCVVIRTFYGHGDSSGGGLRQLIQSLQRQTISTWEAVLLVADSVPFSDLPHILQDLADDRVWVYAEWIGPQYAPRTDGDWTPGYHGLLYNITDAAVRACPASTQWVLITNGDNEYASIFLERLLAAPTADAIAFDYYSRYQRPTGVPCERFARQPGAPACKSNTMQWCHTDLGANALSWPRLMREGLRLGAAGDSEDMAADHNDGLLAHSLLDAGWRVHHVRDACLFDHSPSPQRCARANGVWDDTWAATVERGGACVTAEEAARRLAAGGADLEAVDLALSSDGQLSDFLPGGAGAPDSIRCIRSSNVESSHHQTMVYFGGSCAADADRPALEAFLESGALEAAQEALEAAQVHAARGHAARRQQRVAYELRPPLPPPRDAAAWPSFRKRVPPDILAEHERGGAARLADIQEPPPGEDDEEPWEASLDS
ncbi:hypothetical protein WJX81_002024 [Elliptochloris bilobata]|uniref:EamA domain-containing protein n=1 Tax=Elliptochloris bilobata TaxID=381761 RepID=A0AAW1QNC7_9CHLO